MSLLPRVYSSPEQARKIKEVELEIKKNRYKRLNKMSKKDLLIKILEKI